jgi:hypothetical protein
VEEEEEEEKKKLKYLPQPAALVFSKCASFV